LRKFKGLKRNCLSGSIKKDESFPQGAGQIKLLHLKKQPLASPPTYTGSVQNQRKGVFLIQNEEGKSRCGTRKGKLKRSAEKQEGGHRINNVQGWSLGASEARRITVEGTLTEEM